MSVWGTIAAHPLRAKVLTSILRAAGMNPPNVTAPTVTCEAGARHELANLLNETGGNATPTCVDALVEWPQAVVTVESKFTEPSFGTCGQLRPRIDVPPGAPKKRRDLGPACSGHHGPGSDLKTKTNAPCRLETWDGSRAPRLYWNVAWELFHPEVLVPDGRLCPFRGSSFQLMRNLALARAKAAPRSTRATRDAGVETVQPYWGMLIVDVASHKHAARHRTELQEFRDLLLDSVRPRVGAISYEEINSVLIDYGLEELVDDVARRIASAT